jgi:uroporphyrinogen-III decarboxylase
MKTIPVELVFNPNWWNRNYGISFDQSFYLDRKVRIQNDLAMRAALFERFGIRDESPQPRPIIGSMHVAGGFILPALFGVEIHFSQNEAPWPIQQNLSRKEVTALQAPDLTAAWPMNKLLEDMDHLENEFGYVVGDFDTDGLFNTALHLRGQELFLDLYEDTQLIEHLFTVLTETYISLVILLRRRTGTCAVATNRSVLHFNPSLYLHSNCSIQMVSPQIYEKVILPYELNLARALKTYGIHHCGNNLHRFLPAYSKIPAVFYDVGWGSDVAQCRQALPGIFLNLRLSPVRMLQASPVEIQQDVEKLLAENGSAEHAGICCINMDYGTPDENVRIMIETARDFYTMSK